eukprot:COSAG02_NODE_38237_length_431_cov_1.216867_1_plen_51_part_10
MYPCAQSENNSKEWHNDFSVPDQNCTKCRLNLSRHTAALFGVQPGKEARLC